MAGSLSGDSGWKNFGQYSSFALRVYWSGSQSISGNYTDVTTTMQLRSNNSGSYFDYTSNIGLQINGTSYDDINRRIVLSGNQTITLKSQKVRIGHDGAGRKGYTVYFNFSNPVTGGSGTFSLGVSLKDIPRAYTFIYNTGTVTMDGTQTVLINDNGSGFTAKLYCDFGNKRVTINSNAPKGTNITTAMPSSTYADQIPNATSGVGNIVVETWNGGTKIGTSTLPITLNLPSNIVPSISSISYSDQNATIKGITGSDQILVDNYSVPRMNVSASGVYGSSIREYKFEISGYTITNNGYLTDISLQSYNLGTGSKTVKVTVKDSRGRTASSTDTLDIRAYNPPSMTSFSSERVAATNGAKTTIRVTKSVSISSIKNGTTEKNTYTVVTQIKKATDSAWSTIKTETNTSGNFDLTGYSLTDSYDLKVIVTDRISSATPLEVTDNISTDIVLLDFYKDEGIGIGKYYESGHGALDVGDTIYMLGRSLLNTFYPVGSIYQSTSSTSPSTFMGGTWERFGNGRTIVGVNEGDGDFSSANKTGGEKSHTLSVSEMPSHSHQNTVFREGRPSFSWGWSGSESDAATIRVNGTSVEKATINGGNYLFTQQNTKAQFSEGSGGGQSHNNLQPYVTVYMWRRTA